MKNKTKIVLQKDLIPRVDLDFMNNTHFEEIKMIEELGELVTAYSANKDQQTEQAITHNLNTWLDHTVAHFERENTLMQETGFPAYPIHKNEHDVALNKLKKVLNRWINHQDIELIEDYIFSQWPTWFEQHVNTMDMMTAKFAVMNGYANH